MLTTHPDYLIRVMINFCFAKNMKKISHKSEQQQKSVDDEKCFTQRKEISLVKEDKKLRQR